jgi:DNA gyrase/topoisomerase IV subunit A
MRIEIEVRRGYDAPRLLESILRKPPLEKRLSVKLLVRQAGVEKVLPFVDLLREYRDRRRLELRQERGPKADAVFRRELERWLARSDPRRTQIVRPGHLPMNDV